jgi:HEAT repeat protein
MLPSRDAVLRLLMVLLLGGPGALLVFWPTSPQAAKSDERIETESRFALTVSKLSSEDCLALLGDDLAAGTDRLQAVNELVRRGTASVPPLQRLLSHRNPSIRRYAVMAIGLIGPEAIAALPDALRLSRDTDVGVQIPAIDALVRIAPRDLQVRAILIEGVQSADGTTRMASTEALLSVVRASPDRSAELEEILLQCLASEEINVRLMAVTGLASLSPPRAERLNEALGDDDLQVRLRTINLLGRLGRHARPGLNRLLETATAGWGEEPDEARKALVRLARDLQPELLRALVSDRHGLKSRSEAGLLLAGLPLETDDLDLVVPVLATAARELGDEPHWWARLHQGLANAGPVTPLVLDDLGRGSEPHVRDLVQFVRNVPNGTSARMQRWVACLDDSSAIVRARAAYALGLDPANSVVYADALYAHDRDRDEQARAAIRWALNKLEIAAGPLGSMRMASAY